MVYHCEPCDEHFGSREAYRFHLNRHHSQDLRQVKRYDGKKVYIEDAVVRPTDYELAKRLTKYAKNRRLIGPRSRAAQRRRRRTEAAAAAGAPPPETTLACFLPSSTFTPSSSTYPLPPIPETTSTTCTTTPSSIFALHTSSSSRRPADYHSETSSSDSQVGSADDVSVFGDMSPERFHRFDDLMVAVGTRDMEPRREPPTSSTACQTEPDNPPSDKILLAIQQELYRITLAQPTWPPARICHTMLSNLRLPPPSARLSSIIDCMTSSITGYEKFFSDYLSSAAMAAALNPAASVLLALQEFRMRINRPRDN